MSMFQEAIEDIKYIYENLSDYPKCEFRFSGFRGPIVALHGVGGGWTKDGLRRYMKVNRVGGVLNYFGGMEDGLDGYVDRIGRLVADTPNALILGFSAGGILALKYAQRYGWNSFSKIITVASPLFGSPPARLLSFKGKTYQQLSPGSNYLDEIVNIKPPSEKVMSVFAEQDIKAPFKEVKTLNWPVVIVEAKSHGQIHNNYRTLEHIINKELQIY